MIEFLPALPAKWSYGRLKGIIARGGFEINMCWENGKMKMAAIISRAGNKCKIYSANSMVVNNEVIFPNENNIVEFETAKNKVYTIIF